jgi:glycosyltransferase involved in cell wall biosynthesis
MATYNGEKFIRKQLDSVLNQTCSNLKIYIRDDGSTDQTAAIISEYAQKYPEKIFFIKDNLGNLGVTKNFNELLKHSTAPYISFCDQDDIWLPEKIEKSVARLKEAEKTVANPHLGEQGGWKGFVYSDLKIIDEHDIQTHKSFWKLAKLDPKYFTFSRLLLQNIPHGCTIVMNKAMKDMMFPIPEGAILHDHWLSLLAVNFGEAIPMPEPLVLIRNHGGNVTQRRSNLSTRLKRFYKNFSTKDEYIKHLHIRIKQGKVLHQKYYHQLSKENQYTLDQFLRLETTSGLERKMIYIKNKFFRTTFLYTLKMLWRA